MARARRKVIRLSLDINEDNQRLLHEHLLRFQPQYRGEVVAELFKVVSSNDGPVTYLENRLLTDIEGLITNLNKYTNISGTFESNISSSQAISDDVNVMLDDQINNILGE